MAYIDNFQRVNNPFIGANSLWPSLNIQPRQNIAGAVTQPPTTPTYGRAAFTPNAYTAAQLQGMGGGVVPQWMMNMYSNKIGQMGGNANNPPFSVTQSGFPGVGGKSAPAQGK